VVKNHVGVICVKVYRVEIWEWCALKDEIVSREYHDIEASDEEDLNEQIREIIYSRAERYPHEELINGDMIIEVGKDHLHLLGADVLDE